MIGSNEIEYGNSKAKGDNRIKILTRLNVVIEEISDVAIYSGDNTKPEINALLNSYDIISISPRNDTVFQAVCSNANACHIITLDYTTGGRLPFKLRPNDVSLATKRGAVFEISYAPAILNPDKRKYFIQTGREFFLSSLLQNIHADMIVSSGRRIDTSGGDVGALALRSPQDITNVIEVLFGMNTCNKKQIRSCLSSNPAKVLQFIINKKSCKSFNEKKQHSAQVLFTNQTNNVGILHVGSSAAKGGIKNLSDVPCVGEHFNIMEKGPSPLNDTLNTTTPIKEKEKIEDMDSDKDEVDDGFIAF